MGLILSLYLIIALKVIRVRDFWGKKKFKLNERLEFPLHKRMTNFGKKAVPGGYRIHFFKRISI
jgi:hypothetical protein